MRIAKVIAFLDDLRLPLAEVDASNTVAPNLWQKGRQSIKSASPTQGLLGG